MNKPNVIDFKLKKYERELKNLAKEIGLADFEYVDLELNLSNKDKKLLLICTMETINQLIEAKDDNEELEETYYKQLELLEGLEGSINNQETLTLAPFQFEWPLISLEVGGLINEDSQINKNNIQNIWNDIEFNCLVALYKDLLDKYKIIVKIMNLHSIPKHLRS